MICALNMTEGQISYRRHKEIVRVEAEKRKQEVKKEFEQFLKEELNKEVNDGH